MDERSSAWLPGLLRGWHERVDGAVCTLDYGEVYPQTVRAHISIRFRGPDAVRKIDQAWHQIQAAARNSPLTGPRLVLKQPGVLNAYGTIWHFADSGGFCTLSYSFLHTMRPDSALFHLVWAERGNDVIYAFTADDVIFALSAIENLSELPWGQQEWEDGGNLN